MELSFRQHWHLHPQHPRLVPHRPPGTAPKYYSMGKNLEGFGRRPNRAVTRKARFQGSMGPGKRGQNRGRVFGGMRKEPSLLARACGGWTPLYYRNILGDTVDVSRCIKTGKRMSCAVNNPKQLGNCPSLSCLSSSPLGKKSCLDSKDPTMGHSPWLEAFKPCQLTSCPGPNESFES